MSNVALQGGNRPPYVRFETRSVEDRAASEAAATKQFRSVDYVVISQAGSKDSVEKDAVEWLAGIKTNPNYDPIWVERFNVMYRQFKEGQEITPDGFHVRMWGAIDKAQADTLIAAEIRTVEDLASANEQSLSRVGMGARELQNKARAWLAAADKTGKTAEEIAALRTRNEYQEKELRDLKAQVAQLLSQQVTPPLPAVQKSNDPLISEFLAETA